MPPIMALTAIGVSLALLLGITPAVRAETLTIATVNNPDMVTMQKLSSHFTKATGIALNWVVLPENRVRQRVTMAVATKTNSFDVVMIGAYETPLWAQAGWLDPLDDPGPTYDVQDLFPTVRAALSYQGKLYAVPFSAESSITYYRKDLFAKAGLTMPAQPSYDQIAAFADKITDKPHGIYGICLRGLPGMGENVAYLSTLVNSFGGRWFDMNWQPQLTSPAWETAISYYVSLLRRDGPPNATSNGFTENLALFATGKCGIWIDSTVAAGTLFNPKRSRVANDVGIVPAPIGTVANGSHWLWAWSLAIPASSRHEAAAKKFIAWATSQSYIRLVAQTSGWVSVPPGTRLSTYDNPDYLRAAPFAKLVEQSIATADTAHPTALPVPYTGIQYVDIPAFDGIGTTVGQDVAGALAGRDDVAHALRKAQASAALAVAEAGYTQ